MMGLYICWVLPSGRRVSVPSDARAEHIARMNAEILPNTIFFFAQEDITKESK